MKSYTENKTDDTWKDIPGYEGLYQINKDGEVRSLERKVVGAKGMCKRAAYGSTKKLTLRANGYYAVGLWKNNNQKIENIHRLIAIAFIPNPNNYPEVNHIDGDKTNNKIENLEWCNQSYNVKHAYDTGLNSKIKPVICNETGKIFASASEAARKIGGKATQSSISACARGRRKSAYGYTWEFYCGEKNAAEKAESGEISSYAQSILKRSAELEILHGK